MRVFAATLGWDIGHRAFEDLEQGLLHAFTADIARDRRIVGFPGDLVDFVDVDDAALGAFDIKIGILDQLEQDVFDVFTDIAGLRQSGGIGDGKRDVEDAGQSLGQEGFTRTCRANQQDVAFR